MGMDYGSSAASSTVTQFTLWDTHECRRRTEACPFVRPDCSWDTSDDGCGISRQPVCPSRTGCCFIPCRQECVNARDATLIKVTGTIARGLRWWLGRSCGPCLHRRLRKEKNHGSNSSPTMHRSLRTLACSGLPTSQVELTTQTWNSPPCVLDPAVRQSSFSAAVNLVDFSCMAHSISRFTSAPYCANLASHQDRGRSIVCLLASASLSADAFV
mmetsp:Transcript_20732/g.62461  ORF Transcript_20732/g.62461 Transcript_20732/m.62461 type:complete len:214 (-) Transcript_20732:709-1350(-)